MHPTVPIHRFAVAVLSTFLALIPAVSHAQSSVALPGAAFYPEGIAVDGDGNFYVGSITSGQIETFRAGDATTTTFSSGVLSSAVGMHVDEHLATLWVCGTRDVMIDGALQSQAGVQGLELGTGAAVAFHPLAGGGFCNDIAQDNAGNLYITDSAGWRVVRIAAADLLADTPTEDWLLHEYFELEPGEGTGLSVNGIAFDGRNRLYVVNITRGELYSIHIRGCGEPGLVRRIELDRPLDGPDGIEVIDRHTVAIAENFSSTLSTVRIRGNHGRVEPQASGLGDSPTTFVVEDGSYWVVIGQLDRLFSGNPNPPSLPFEVVEVPLEP